MTVEHVSKTTAKKSDEGYVSFNDILLQKLSVAMGMMAMLQSTFSCVISALSSINGKVTDIEDALSKRWKSSQDLLNKVNVAQGFFNGVSNMGMYFSPLGAGGLGAMKYDSPAAKAFMGMKLTFHVVPQAVSAITTFITAGLKANSTDWKFNLELASSVSEMNTQQNKKLGDSLERSQQTMDYFTRAIMKGYEVESRVVH